VVAKQAIAGLILPVCNREPDQRTLAEVRNLLSACPEEYLATLSEMSCRLRGATSTSSTAPGSTAA
jgi:hypothetical protein